MNSDIDIVFLTVSITLIIITGEKIIIICHHQ